MKSGMVESEVKSFLIRNAFASLFLVFKDRFFLKNNLIHLKLKDPRILIKSNVFQQTKPNKSLQQYAKSFFVSFD